MKVTPEIILRIVELVAVKSISEVAVAIGCSESTVSKVIKDHNIQRTPQQKASIRSRVRTDLIRAERRRAIFGLDQKTDIKVFSNRERNTLKYCLRRKGYIFKERGAHTAYFGADTKRDNSYENRGRKLGLAFMPIESFTTT